VILPNNYDCPAFNTAKKNLDKTLTQVSLLHLDLNTPRFKLRVYDRLRPLPVFPHNGTAKQKQEMKLDYAIRRFEIDIETMFAFICDCCGVMAVAEGVFERKYGTGKFPANRKPIKFVFRFDDGTYKYLHPKDLPEDVQYEKMVTVCRCCLNDTKDVPRQPRFTPAAGFIHGNAPLGDVLSCLTYAEIALIQVYQPILRGDSLSSGMRVKTGQVSFVSRLSELEHAATVLPRLQTDLDQQGIGTKAHFASQLQQLCQIALQKASTHGNASIKNEVQSCVAQWLESIQQWESRMDTSS
jgi:hypothetical protein